MQKENLEFIDEAIHSGFCTHIYLESGFLDDKDPVFRFFRGQDERRSVFDLASMTKALVTAPLAYTCWIDKKTAIAEFNHSFLRDFSKDFRNTYSNLTLESLLSHRSGLPGWLNFWLGRLNPQVQTQSLYSDRMEIIQKVIERTAYIWAIPLSEERYSDVGFMLLALALEDVHNQDFSDIFSSFISNQGMKSKIKLNEQFCFPASLQHSRQNYITSAYCPIRDRWLKGEVHDENCAALGGVSGHAGLFGSGPRVSAYLKSLYASDIGYKFFEENEARRVASKGLLGLRPGDDTASGRFCGGYALGHWGFTGTGFWVHVPSKRYAIVLTNRVISGRVSSKIMPFRVKALSYLNDTLI